MAHPETEEKIKEETKATIRCIPLDARKKMVFVFIQANHLQVELFLPKHINIF
jgi:hypothetical protein